MNIFIIVCFALFSAISCNNEEKVTFDSSLQLEQIGTYFMDTNVLDQKRYLAYKQAFDNRMDERECVKGPAQIPLIIHQIWLGSEPIPSNVETLQQTWKIAHPDWKFILWTKENIHSQFPEAFVVMEKFDNDQIRQQWVASLILEKMGGVTVSPYSKCYKSLAPFHHSQKFYAGLMAPYIKPKEGRRLWVGTDFVGAVSGSPVIVLWRKELEKEIDMKNKRSVKGQLGSAVDALIAEGGVIIFPPTYFYPVAQEFQKRFMKKDNKIKFKKPSFKKRIKTLFNLEQKSPFSTIASETVAINLSQKS